MSLLPWGDETGFMPTSDFKLFAGFYPFVTGLLVGGGTKALHDLILRIEKGKERAAASATSTAAEEPWEPPSSGPAHRA